VSITGEYDLNLLPSNYVIYVAYPDGTDKTATVNIERGSLQELRVLITKLNEERPEEK
jgi:hypothetical protein